MKKSIKSLYFTYVRLSTIRIFILTIFNLIFFNLTNLQSVNAQMFWNQAASFSGSASSYVSVPNSATTNITGSFSLEAWINPANTLNKGVISKGGTLLKYAIRITGSRVVLSTNGAPRLSSKSTSLIPVNTWTHIAATHNTSTSEYKIFINGQFDTSAIVGVGTPTSNSDSLYVGFSGVSTPFNGQIDEVRVWNRVLSESEISKYFRTSLCASNGVYSGLILSMPFQKESSSGTKFTARDLSGHENNGNARNVSAVDQSFRPLQTISQNDNIELDGDEDYLAAKDTSTLNPTDVVTLECWVYPRSSNQTCNLISKGNQYAIILENGVFKFRANGSTVSSGRTIPVNQWSQLAVQFNAVPEFHVDGLFLNVSMPFLGILSTGTDSLFIGGAPGATGDFNGYMDEVRILNSFFSDDEIYHMTFQSIDKSNAPAGTMISYNLDGALNDNTESGGPVLNFRNNSQFSHPGSTEYKPVSPLLRNEANTFPEGFYRGEENIRIPLTAGTSGATNYILNVNLDAVINDIDVIIALNHTNLSSLNITIVAPNNDSVRISSGLSTTTADNSLVTIFDDQADSSFAANKYVSFHTTMKPQNNMNSVFGGDNSFGTWKIRINDIAAGDTGVLNMFGIKINNMPLIESSMSLTNLIQGFYNPSTNLTIGDTVKLFIRKNYSPYEIVDSCSRKMNIFGGTHMSFKNVVPDTHYTVSLKHRNSIEIWSNITRKFTYTRSAIAFHLSAVVTVYGGNEVQVDTSPVRFAMYGGDVNQDGVVDATDLGLIDNDAFNFVTGYVNADLTGDDVVDASDAAIADNNAANFVTVITPLNN